MATKKITRSIPSTIVKVTALDEKISSDELTSFNITLEGKYTDNAKALKKIKRQYNTDTCTVVKAEIQSVERTKYTMSEAEFLANATKID